MFVKFIELWPTKECPLDIPINLSMKTEILSIKAGETRSKVKYDANLNRNHFSNFEIKENSA